MSHANLQNRFVGYAVRTIDEKGKVDYQYFTRSVPWFNALISFLISDPNKQLATSVHVARQCMNVIYLLTLAVAFLLLRRLLRDDMIALTAALLACSGYYYVFYKDMVSSDPPALFGMMLILYSIVRYRQTGKVWLVYLATLIGVSLGRGYASIPVLSLWFVIEAWFVLRSESYRPKASLLRLVRLPALKALAIASLLVATYIGYNVLSEAAIRNVSAADTSIVDSMMRRSGLKTSFAQERTEPLTWSRHLGTQVKRIVTSAIPFPFGVHEDYKRNLEYYLDRLTMPGFILLLTIGVYFILAFIKTRPPAERPVYALLCLAGIVWLGPMKNMALPHPYTSIFHFSLLLVLYAAMVERFLSSNPKLTLLLAIVVFVAANLSANATHRQTASRVNAYTADFQVISDLLEPNAKVHVDAREKRVMDGAPAIVEGVPYAVAFYLNRAYFSPIEAADYFVTDDRAFALQFPDSLLTPSNNQVFLLRADHIRNLLPKS
jgi:4-amino-4-deoxy-L-arabinose transferase-like glycosyltransferase